MTKVQGGESASQRVSESANQRIGESANQQISKPANQQISKSAERQGGRWVGFGRHDDGIGEET
jgi:hypothetical protein